MKRRRSTRLTTESDTEGEHEMRKLVVGTFLTVDGVMQGPGGPDEDRDGAFSHGGWSATYWDESMNAIIGESTSKAGALLLGRKTYEIFAAHWPHVGEDQPDAAMAARLNSIPKYVASRTLDEVTWENSTLLEGDVAEAVRALKEEPGGEIQVTGSGDLAQTLIEHDLVDEYRLWIFPLVLGEGKRLFGRGTVPGALNLLDTHVSSTGVTIHTYERAGDIRYGSFALDQDGEEGRR
jgi:dihydrofolate reductase